MTKWQLHLEGSIGSIGAVVWRVKEFWGLRWDQLIEEEVGLFVEGGVNTTRETRNRIIITFIPGIILFKTATIGVVVSKLSRLALMNYNAKQFIIVILAALAILPLYYHLLLSYIRLRSIFVQPATDPPRRTNFLRIYHINLATHVIFEI